MELESDMESPTNDLVNPKQDIYSNSLMMLWVNQQTYQITYANEQALSFYQYSLKQLQSFQFDELCVDNIDNNKDLKQGLDGELDYFTVTHRTANNAIKFIEIHVTKTQYNNQPHLFMILIDVTQRQQAIQRLEEKKAHYRIIAEFNHDWVFWITPDSLLSYVSPSCEHITGYSPQAFIENPLLMAEIIHNDDIDLWNNHIEQLTNDKDTPQHSLQFRIKHRDGEIRWIEHVSQIVIDENNIYRGHRASNRDITQRKQIEQELKESKEWLDLTVENAGMATWEWDIVNGGRKYDEKWAELLGYTYGEIQPSSDIWERLVHPQDKPKSLEQWNNVLDGTIEMYEVEHRLQCKSGEWRWFLSRGTFVEHTQDNKPTRFIGIDIDITKRKVAEIASFQYELERQRMDVLATFIQNAKHEFKTPLSRINTKLYMIRRIQDEEKRNQIADSIESQVEEIDHLVDSMMLMARLDTVNSIPNNTVDIRDILNTLVVQVEPRVKTNQLTLVSEIPTKVPAIRGITDDLYEAFLRIIDNAIRYTPPHGHINLSLKIAQSNIIVEIRDTGAGISEEALPHVFERFFREDQAHSTSGIGLGLSIAKSIIEQYKGDIRISSSVHVGTIVQVRLPLRHS
jgi:two-component system, sensor histidine kinase and response regulator